MNCPALDSQKNHCVLPEGHEGAHLRQLPPGHYCHAYGCPVPVPPKMLMCLKHWRMVPRDLQKLVWATYRPGQEDDKNPSVEYIFAQQMAIKAVREREGKVVPRGDERRES